MAQLNRLVHSLDREARAAGGVCEICGLPTSGFVAVGETIEEAGLCAGHKGGSSEKIHRKSLANPGHAGDRDGQV